MEEKHAQHASSRTQTGNMKTEILFHNPRCRHRCKEAGGDTPLLTERSGVIGSKGRIAMASGNGLASLGVEGATAAAQALSLPAEAYGNDPQLEVMWAMKAYNHAEIYFNLISSVDPSHLKLTKVDDLIYKSFREYFSDLNIKNLDPDMLKSSDAKEKWRPFCNQFDGVVEDFNYGTLLRLDCEKDYTEENTIFATRIQFFAVEIARNREGFNTPVFQAKTPS